MPEELENFVEEVEGGRYESDDELLRDALRLKMSPKELGPDMIKGNAVEMLEDSLEGVEKGNTYSAE